ncbi:MAG: acyl-CoA/acyl-ACP dehydrogenase [Proteobacteria bacterium]|nr:acyl-CoA/acyl-ACP dehydrogenase [Pseudomonadota bacterium]
MDYDLNKEQKTLATSAREFLKKECPPSLLHEMKDDEKGYPQKLWDQMAELGWTGVIVPEKYGGIGGSFLDLCILLETMGEACCPAPFFSTVVLGGLAVMLAGNEEQKETHLSKIANGESIFALAMQEPASGYGTSRISMPATADRDDYILNGTKLFVENAGVADQLLCVARTDPQKPVEEGLTVFLVDAGSPGINYTPLKTLAFDKKYEVVFEQVRVPKKNVLGEVNQAWSMLETLQEQATVAKCAEILGGMQASLDMAVAYAKERTQFGRPIGSFQAIQHHCANMLADVDGSRFITNQAAWKIAEGLPVSMDASMAKAWTTGASRRVTLLNHQIHGGVSFCMDYDVHLYYRRGKAAEAAFGDYDFHLEKIADQLETWYETV